MRVAALELPELGLQAAIRAGEADPSAAVVLVVRRSGRQEVCGVSLPARTIGILPGMTLSQARALWPSVQDLPADPERNRALLRGLAEALLPLAPAVELAPPQTLLLDASAAGRLTGAAGRAAEEAWGLLLLEAVSEFGLRGAVAVADAPETARLGALGAEEVRVVPPSPSAQVPGELPLSLVQALGERLDAPGRWPLPALPDERPLWPAVAPQSWALLERLGVDTVEALLRLPERTLSSRLGADAQALLLLARGGRPRPLRPFRPPEALEEALEIDPPLENAQGVLFLARPMVERLAARLQARGRTGTRLVLGVETDAAGQGRGGFGPRRERRRILLEPARPVDRAQPLLDLLRDRLGGLQVEGGITGLSLTVVETGARGGQFALADRPRDREALESVLSRLSARCGEDAVGALRLQPRWLPEQGACVVPFEAERPPPGDASLSGPSQLLTVRTVSNCPEVPPRPLRLRSPEPIAPECSPEGVPRAFEWQGRRHRVLGWMLPERLATAWWEDTPAREYLTLTLEGGLRVWAFRDPLRRWWIQGVHD